MSLGDSIGSSLGRAIGAALSGGSDYVSIVENGALASFVTFTRASTATYFDSAGVMQTAAINTPRVNYDPATLTLLGFLREPQRTNLLLRSQEFDNASWSAANLTISANAIVAPDGTTTADKLEATATAVTYIQQIAVVNAASATYSIFTKAGNRATAMFLMRNITTMTDFDYGTFTYATGVITGTGWTATNVGGGWYRLTYSRTTGITSGDTIRVYAGNTGGSMIAGDYWYVWGAQLEAGSYATSYIPTTSAAVTRSADRALIATPTTQIGFNTQQGTFYGAFSPVADGINAYLVGYSSGAQGCGRYSGGSISIHDGTTYRTPSGGAALAAGVEGRFAYSYLSGNATEGCAFNGTAKTYTSDGDIVSGVTAIDVGASQGGGADAVHIRTLRYYGRRLSGVEQSAITA